jgi:Domain of unknown function (DUF4290)
VHYNTTLEPVKYPEYGRFIQELLQYACTIPDDRERRATVETVVGMMQMVNPNAKNSDDWRERLWNHAFAIAEYQLNVEPPANIQIRREDEKVKAEPLAYPAHNFKFRHYGSHIQKLMEKAISMPDGPKKEGFVEVIASYMKLAYKTWSKEHYVSDDIVKEDLESMTEGQLELHEGHSSLDTLAIEANRREKEMLRARARSKNNNNNKGGNRRGGSNSGNNNSGNSRKTNAGGGSNSRKRRR